MPPLAFSDSELDTLMSLSTPLHPSRRAEYLEAVAAAIAEYPERGDGLTNRGRPRATGALHARTAQRPQLRAIAALTTPVSGGTIVPSDVTP